MFDIIYYFNIETGLVQPDNGDFKRVPFRQLLATIHFGGAVDESIDDTATLPRTDQARIQILKAFRSAGLVVFSRKANWHTSQVRYISTLSPEVDRPLKVGDTVGIVGKDIFQPTKVTR